MKHRLLRLQPSHYTDCAVPSLQIQFNANKLQRTKHKHKKQQQRKFQITQQQSTRAANAAYGHHLFSSNWQRNTEDWRTKASVMTWSQCMRGPVRPSHECLSASKPAISQTSLIIFVLLLQATCLALRMESAWRCEGWWSFEDVQRHELYNPPIKHLTLHSDSDPAPPVVPHEWQHWRIRAFTEKVCWEDKM
jgi:hypothetical protein